MMAFHVFYKDISERRYFLTSRGLPKFMRDPFVPRTTNPGNESRRESDRSRTDKEEIQDCMRNTIVSRRKDGILDGEVWSYSTPNKLTVSIIGNVLYFLCNMYRLGRVG
jgi:hypothetical protein